MESGVNKKFIWLSVVLAAAGLIVALVIRPIGVDKSEALTKHVEQLSLEASSLTPPRSVLRGQPNPGNAWDEYNLALDDAAAWHGDENGGVFLRFAKGDN